ncbi:MAG: 2-oxo acid dehydrogenase subunit E2 [Nitrospiraceae bacterium]|nr:2-oxo acid dehydrogenase subunit E2 [Nitrospiraceae bacterium]
MKTPIPMPVLSDTMKTGRLAAWNKQPGDHVRAGESLAVMESDKAVMDIEAFSDGFLSGPLAPTGTDIPVGSPIGYLCDTKEECREEAGAIHESPVGEKGTNPPPAAPAPEEGAAPPPPAPSETKPAVSGRQSETPPAASPYARGLAGDLGIPLDSLPPASDGLIHARAVLERALGTPPPDLTFAPPAHKRPPTAMESAIARNMEQSLRTPIFHLSTRVSFRTLSAATGPAKLSLTLLLCRAAALAIIHHPRINALWSKDGIYERERIDIGIAVDTGNGLVTPVLRDVGGRPLPEIAEDWRILKEMSLKGRLAPENYSGGTFYLSNLGMFQHVVSFDAILPASAGAILAVSGPDGKDGGNLLTLTCDHRTIYGAQAAAFMATLAGLIDNPAPWTGVRP